MMGYEVLSAKDRDSDEIKSRESLSIQHNVRAPVSKRLYANEDFEAWHCVAALHDSSISTVRVIHVFHLIMQDAQTTT